MARKGNSRIVAMFVEANWGYASSAETTRVYDCHHLARRVQAFDLYH
jgi:hypothetical protein